MDEMNGQNINAEPMTQNNMVFSVPVDVKSLTGWATFKAIMEIIGGAVACASIIGATYGVPMIIAAVKLLNFIDETKQAVASGDQQRIINSLSYLQRYFKLNGIAQIVSIAVAIVFIVLYIILIVFLVTNGQFMDSFSSTSGQWSF